MSRDTERPTPIADPRGRPRILPAATTPFAGERIDTARLRDNLARWEAAGLDGYLLLGSTGEAVLLDEPERTLVLRAVRAGIPAGKPLVAGLTAESTRAAIRQAREAADCGADFVLVSTPHYYREGMTPAALVAHFEAVAAASPVPILLYNVPKFTGLVLPAETVSRAAAHPNVAGIKESSGEPAQLAAALATGRPRFAVFCGAASRLADALEAGAAGGILAAAVAFPEPFLEIVRLVGAGESAAAAQLQLRVAETLAPVASLGVAGLKAAMDLRGLAGGAPRSPLLSLAAPERAAVDAAIASLVESGILPARELGA